MRITELLRRWLNWLPPARDHEPDPPAAHRYSGPTFGYACGECGWSSDSIPAPGLTEAGVVGLTRMKLNCPRCGSRPVAISGVI